MKGPKKMVQWMGQIVQVDFIYQRRVIDGNPAKVFYQELKAQGRAGWIVGLRFLQEGTIVRSRRDEDDGFIHDETYLHIENILPAIQVVYWPTMKPVLVPVHNVRQNIQYNAAKPRSPAEWSWMTTTSSIAQNDFINVMRAEMKDWPRDSKGHWIRKVKQS